MRRVCGQLEELQPRVQGIIAQTRARVFGGDTHFEGKLLSVFEPHTEAIRKGKAAKPTEFGKLVKLHEGENQIIVDYEVFAKRPADATLLQPTVKRHKELLGRAPELLAADRGFWSAANKKAALAAGVKKVCVPAMGGGRLSNDTCSASAGSGADNGSAPAAKDASASSSAATDLSAAATAAWME